MVTLLESIVCYHYKEEFFMDLEQIRQNRTKMILQFSIPSIIAMILTSLVTIADGFFIGNYVGKDCGGELRASHYLSVSRSGTDGIHWRCGNLRNGSRIR